MTTQTTREDAMSEKERAATPPWHFWNPKSGLMGSFIMGCVIALALAFVKWLLS
jgi:hypothetical protein